MLAEDAANALDQIRVLRSPVDDALPTKIFPAISELLRGIAREGAIVPP
jgi:hypothetical protein